MAQRTGQASRRTAGTEKASRKGSGARNGRGGTTRAGSSSNGRASSKARTGSTSRASSNGRASSKSRSRPTAKRSPSKAAVPAKRAASKRRVRTLGQAVRPVARHLPEVTERLRAIAVPVGAAGAGLAAASAGAAAVRRSRRPASPLTRFGRTIRSAKPRRARSIKRTVRSARPSVPRPNLPHPNLPSPAQLLPEHKENLWLAAIPAGLQATTLLGRARRLPIQRCVDVAVPLRVAYDEWMRLDFLPEGSHLVHKIERDGDDRLTGRLKGPWPRRWEAEIRDQRDCESFAWRSVRGSDCAGLITFHSLGERLTRLELQLDVVPIRPLETVAFLSHAADARAEAELRRFKARLETINPDSYGDTQGEGQDESDGEEPSDEDEESLEGDDDREVGDEREVDEDR